MFANGIVVFALFWLLFMQAPGAHGPAPFAAYVVAHSPRLKDLHAGQLSWPVLIVAMILNAFLEEIICTAYAFCQFAARNGPAFAVLLTVVLRAACHTYQGAVHACGIGAAFLIYALWYWRTRNLWTLIVAHAVLDLTSLSAVKIFAP
jgi:membrane protease YdiL (CAAX protease family)